MAEKLENSPSKCVAVQPPSFADELDSTHSLLRKVTNKLNNLTITGRSLLSEISQKIDEFPLSGSWLLETLIHHAKDEEIIKSVVRIIFNDSIFTDQNAGRNCINVCVYISRNMGSNPADLDPRVCPIIRDRTTDLNKTFWPGSEDDTNDLNRTFRRVVLAKCDEFVAEFKPLVREDPLRFCEFVMFIKQLFVVSNRESLFSFPHERDVCDLYILMLDFPDDGNLDCLRKVLVDSYEVIKNWKPLEDKMRLMLRYAGRSSQILQLFRNVLSEMQ